MIVAAGWGAVATVTLLVGMMFLTGFFWGRTTRFGAWRSGAAMLVFGVAMVGIAVLFGG